MQKTCANGWCKQFFEVTEEDLAFYDKVSPVIGGKKYLVPPPTLCPDCRAQRRNGHVNRIHLYRRTSSWSGKEIISIFSPEKTLPVYENDVWWSDQWDPFSYARPVDLSSPLFPQLQSLFSTVPVMALLNDENENSPYVNTTGWAKNCYLCYGADYSEDCLYGEAIYYSRNSLDCLHGQNLEQCYDCIDCNDGHTLLSCQNCNNCSDSAFLYDCIGCKSCFACFGLRQKRHCYLNEQLSETEYRKKVAQHSPLTPTNIARVRQLMELLRLRHPHKSMIGTANENVSGDYVFNSKNSHLCFDSDELQDCTYCSNMRKAKDCQDVNYWGHPSELCYEDMGTGEGATGVLFSAFVWGGTSNMFYCAYCIACHDCFGCSGLRHKRYCIFNRQCEKQEYEELVGKIIPHMQQTGEWGEFPPLSASHFAYNESLAQRFYPLSPEEVRKRGWQWRNVTDDVPAVSRTIPAESLPERIDDVPDDVLNWAIICEATKRPFKIIKPELVFYREHKLPLPRLHPDERLRCQWLLRNPRTLWSRTCGKCRKPIRTTYAPKRPEIVYCEGCYLKEVY